MTRILSVYLFPILLSCITFLSLFFLLSSFLGRPMHVPPAVNRPARPLFRHFPPLRTQRTHSFSHLPSFSVDRNIVHTCTHVPPLSPSISHFYYLSRVFWPSSIAPLLCFPSLCIYNESHVLFGSLNRTCHVLDMVLGLPLSGPCCNGVAPNFESRWLSCLLRCHDSSEHV